MGSAPHAWPAAHRISPARASRHLMCHRDGVLSQMRDRRGGPNVRMRALALLLCLLLAGPLTVLLWSMAVRLVNAVL